MRTNGLVKAILADTRGATAVEYGLILALVVIAMIASLQSMANEHTALWTRIQDNVVQPSS
jgi:pilus assembly protein Flp/PilA